MSSRRPPRRDPRAEDGAAPPADDLGGIRKPGRAPTRVPSQRPPSSRPSLTGAAADEFEALRSRYAEAESKRRRAEALSDGLAQRVAQLEGELKDVRHRTPAPTGDDGRRRLEAKIAELEHALASQASVLAGAQAKLEVSANMLTASESANAELDAKVARERARADAAEDELARFEEKLANGELVGAESANANEGRFLELERQLAEASTARAVAHANVAEAEARARAAESKLGEVEARARDAEAEATEAAAKLAEATAKHEDLDARHEARHAALSSEASAKVTELEGRLAALQSRLTAAENQLVVGETAISEASDRVNAAEAKLESTEWKLTMTEAKVAEAETALAAATAKLATLEPELARARADAEETAKKLGAEETAHGESATKLAAAEAKLATTAAKLGTTEAKLGTAQAMATELDQALQRERARVAEIEAGHRRVQAAAVSSAREVLSRLERHEHKLAGLRKDALSRAISLLDEAGGVHAPELAQQAARLTPAVPASRPAIAVLIPRDVPAPKEPTAAKDTSTKDTAPPPVPRPSKSDEGSETKPGPTPPPVAARSEAAPTPIKGTSRQTGRNKRTQQGLAALPRGAFAGETTSKKSTIPPRSEGSVPPRVDDGDVVEITIDED